MELSPIVQVALLQAATQIPFIIAIAVGLWLAIARRKRHPGASLWAIIGFSALGIQIACRVAASAFVTALGAGAIPDNTAAVTSLVAFSNVAAYLLFLAGIVALSCAVFVGRKTQ